MIKFRAYCENCKKYTYFNDVEHHFHNYNGILQAFCTNGDNDFGDFQYSLTNIEQFTGLKDKNGKEIYVGDILKREDGRIGRVVFEDGSLILEEHGTSLHWLIERVKENIEEVFVIGNINENKELLE